MIAQEYLDYMNESYRQEYAYIQKKDIAVDHDKLRMFFDKSVTPYKYWLDEHKRAEMAGKDIDKAGMLNALKTKYKLIPTKTGLKLPGYLNDKDEFRRLSENMRMCGYEYSREEQEFVKMEVAAHV